MYHSQFHFWQSERLPEHTSKNPAQVVIDEWEESFARVISLCILFFLSNILLKKKEEEEEEDWVKTFN